MEKSVSNSSDPEFMPGMTVSYCKIQEEELVPEKS